MAITRALEVSLLTLALAGTQVLADERPNIVLILADDVGYSDIGAFGGEISTPNIDALASRGVRLMNFHVGPTCGPSRAMLITGADHHRVGAGVNAAGLLRLPHLRGRPGYEGYLNDRALTVATILRDAGYQTFVAGKWDPGPGPGKSLEERGFDRSFVLTSGGASHFSDAVGNFRPRAEAVYLEDGERLESLPDDFYSSAFYTDRIREYIAAADVDRPYFAYLSFTAAHWPLQVPDEWIDRYRGRYDGGWQPVRAARLERQRQLGVVPPDTKLPEQNRVVMDWDALSPVQRQIELRRMEIYAAMIQNMDFHIGRLMEELYAGDNDRETIVLFFSDNGPEGNAIDLILDNRYWIPATFDNRLSNMGRRGSYVWPGAGWAQVSATPLRLYKSYTTAGGIRTPAIVYSTDGRFAPASKDEIVTVRDIAPTLLELAGADRPGARYNGREVEPMSGKSILDYLGGATDEVHGDEPLGWELYGSRALIRGDWKLTLIFPPEGPGRWELFDIAADPAESTDLAEAHPELVEELAADWHEYARQNDVAVFEEDVGYGRYVN